MKLLSIRSISNLPEKSTHDLSIVTFTQPSHLLNRYGLYFVSRKYVIPIPKFLLSLKSFWLVDRARIFPIVPEARYIIGDLYVVNAASFDMSAT